LASPPSTSRRFSSKVAKIPIILSTGWDRRIHIWLEGDAASEAIQGVNEGEHVTPCSKRIPESEAALRSSLHHSDDVTSLCFCPPETIVTGGYGGMMIGWHVHSGAARFRYKFEHPVEAMCWLGDTVKLLAVGRSHGQIAIFNVDQGYLLEDCDGPFPLEDEATLLSALTCDCRGEYVIAGDSVGFIHIWTTMGMAIQRSHRCDWLNPFSSFNAHRERITSISHVDHTHATETFVIAASLDGTASMWTLSGMPVGVFGQLNPWDIHNKSTWANGGRHVENLTATGNGEHSTSPMRRNHGNLINSSRSRRQRRNGKRDGLARRERLMRKDSNLRKITHLHQPLKDSPTRKPRRPPRRGSMQTLLDMSGKNGILTVGTKSGAVPGIIGSENEHEEIENDSEIEPQVGQVWIRVDDDAEEIINAITIVRIDPKINAVTGHDGMFDARELHKDEKPIHIELNYHRMLLHRKRTVRNKAVWRLERNLTACVGRIYKESRQYHPFKVLYPFLSKATSTSLKPDWWVVDTKNCAHRLPEGDLQMAPRSLSMYNMIALNEQRQKAEAANLEKEESEEESGVISSDNESNKDEKYEDDSEISINTNNDSENLGVGNVTEVEESLLLPKKRRGRRNSINHMPDNNRLEHYKKTIGAGDHDRGSDIDTIMVESKPIRPPSSKVKRSTDVLNGISRGGLFFHRELQGLTHKQQREASYKRLMKARAETRARKSVKDERIIKNIREIPIEWHGTKSLIEPLEDGPAAWHKSLFGKNVGNSSGGNGKHHHHNHHKKKVHAIKKAKTALERHLDLVLARNAERDSRGRSRGHSSFESR
jgi:hypothetical protein